MQTSGRVEYMYVATNEEIEIKLVAKHFKKITSRKHRCSSERAYSVIRCEEVCFWHQTTSAVGCRGPWMQGLSLPLCHNYTSMKELIVKYEK